MQAEGRCRKGTYKQQKEVCSVEDGVQEWYCSKGVDSNEVLLPTVWKWNWTPELSDKAFICEICRKQFSKEVSLTVPCCIQSTFHL